jgi:hypothetical protein
MIEKGGALLRLFYWYSRSIYPPSSSSRTKWDIPEGQRIEAGNRQVLPHREQKNIRDCLTELSRAYFPTIAHLS